MYTRHFRLKEKPFSDVLDQRFLFLGDHHKDALKHLQNGLNRNGGVVLLTGEGGVGKTYLCRKFIEEISSDINVALILNSKLRAMDFLAAVCDELGINYNTTCRTNEEYLAAIHSYLLQALATGKKTAIIIDDAHKLDSEVFIQLQKLTNSKNTPQTLLHIFLIGRAELLSKLKKPELASLLDDVVAEFRLPVLGRDEIKKYIDHRLAVAGRTSGLFSPDAYESIYKYSKGNPQKTNYLCERALEKAYSQGNDKLNRTIVDQAADILERDSKRQNTKRRRKGGIFSKILLLLLICILAFAFFMNFPFIKKQIGRITNNIKSVSVETKSGKSNGKSSFVTPSIDESLSADPAWLNLDDKGTNKKQALSDLFALWNVHNISKSKTTKDLKDKAKKHGLIYAEKQANWPGLLYYNYPAILEVEKSDGSIVHIVLAALLDKNVIVKVNGNEYLLPQDEVKKVWTGRFSFLINNKK